MQYRKLGRSGVEVSELCLGTMTFGEQNSESEAFAQLDRAIAAGINFIDTAEMYPIPPSAKTCGRTETIIGKWLRKSGRRREVILASKVIGKGSWLPHIRGGTSRPDRENILLALEGSLRRLQTDYIDLYQIHWPARETNYFGKLGYTPAKTEATVSIESTLQALGEIVDSGKVRFIGISNETPWGVMRYLHWAQQHGLPRVVSIQNPYNLLNRSFEIGLAEIAHREDVGLLAYSPLAFGTLTGKYLNASPEKARLSLFPHYSRYSKSEGVAATRAYVELARSLGISPAQMALAYINSRPFVTSNIIGATTLAQLEENLDSVNLPLSEEAVREIESIHQRIPNPCP